MTLNSIGKDNAIRLANSGWWKGLTAHEIVRFQLFTSELCMPIDEFQDALEGALGRSVWTHELAYAGLLQSEFLKELPPPDLNQIMNLIPAEKRIILNLEEKA